MQFTYSLAGDSIKPTPSTDTRTITSTHIYTYTCSLTHSLTHMLTGGSIKPTPSKTKAPKAKKARVHTSLNLPLVS